jgi:hypothetical protein
MRRLDPPKQDRPPYVRQMPPPGSGRPPTLDFKDIMDEGKILICNLSVGEIGRGARRPFKDRAKGKSFPVEKK